MSLEGGREEVSYVRNTSATSRSTFIVAEDPSQAGPLAPAPGEPWDGAVDEGDAPPLPPLRLPPEGMAVGGDYDGGLASGDRVGSSGGGGQATLLGMIRTLSNRIHDGVEVWDRSGLLRGGRTCARCWGRSILCIPIKRRT